MAAKKNNQFVQELVVVRSSQYLVGALISPKTLRKKVAQNIFLKNGYIETLYYTCKLLLWRDLKNTISVDHEFHGLVLSNYKHLYSFRRKSIYAPKVWSRFFIE